MAFHKADVGRSENRRNLLFMDSAPDWRSECRDECSLAAALPVQDLGRCH
jgi:hypothetical protein